MESILRTYYNSKNISDLNLSIKLFRRDISSLKSISNKVIKKIKPHIIEKYNIDSIDSFVEAGSGSLPTEKMKSISIVFYSNQISVNKIYNLFLKADTPIVGFISNELYHIDLKAIPDDQVDLLIETINKI
jgi:L-seryl-tRNA(Ser) seleniumtransferase